MTAWRKFSAQNVDPQLREELQHAGFRADYIAEGDVFVVGFHRLFEDQYDPESVINEVVLGNVERREAAAGKRVLSAVCDAINSGMRPERIYQSVKAACEFASGLTMLNREYLVGEGLKVVDPDIVKYYWANYAGGYVIEVIPDLRCRALMGLTVSAGAVTEEDLMDLEEIPDADD